MDDFWSRNLQIAQLGATQFPLLRMSRTGGRRTARHMYPYRDGQDVEDLGRAPLQWDIVVPLFQGMDPINPLVPLYPETYDSLRLDLDDPDTRGETEYIDPELGPVAVKVVSHTWDAVAEKRNGGVFRIRLEERSTDAFVFAIGGLLDPDLEGLELAAEIDAGTGDLDIAGAWAAIGLAIDFIFLPGELFVGMVDDFFGAIESGALAADELAARIDRIRNRLDRVLAFDVMQEAERWSIYQSTVRLSATLTVAGERVVQDAPQVVEFVVPWEMSHFEIAVLLYSDRGRAGEIVQRNPVLNPLFYPEQRVLRVLDR